MKTYILACLILTGPLLCFSQDTLTKYYDANWESVNPEKYSYTYIRKAYQQDGLWKIMDYDKENNLLKTGSYADAKFKNKQGLFRYYKDGKLEEEGGYEKNKQQGVWKYFHENGKLFGIGSYEKDKKIDQWKWYHANEQLSADEKYKKGKLFSATYFDEKGLAENETLHEDRQAEFPGGEQALKEYLLRNIHYPKSGSPATSINGIVYVEFSINTEGRIENAKVTKSVHPDLDAEALSAISLMPKWTQAKRHNVIMKQYFTIPVLFQRN